MDCDLSMETDEGGGLLLSDDDDSAVRSMMFGFFEVDLFTSGSFFIAFKIASILSLSSIVDFSGKSNTGLLSLSCLISKFNNNKQKKKYFR